MASAVFSFCVQGGNALTQELLRRLTQSGTMFLIPAAVGTKLIIRFTVTSQFTQPEDVQRDWGIIQRTATELMRPGGVGRPLSLSLSTDTEASEDEAETLWQEQEEEKLSDQSAEGRMRLELMIDKHLVRQGQRRATRSMSCSAELPPTRPDSAHTLREAPPSGALAQIPESPVPAGGRRGQKRLLKFHSVPSLWQCAMQNIYRPLHWTTSRASYFTCCPLPQK